MPGAEYIKQLQQSRYHILKYPLETESTTGSVVTQPAYEKLSILTIGIISVIVIIKDLNLLNRKIS